MKKTVFKIAKMDCPSEENLIRIKLGDIPEIHNLDFNIPDRKLTVSHDDQLDLIHERIDDLNLGSEIISSEDTEKAHSSETGNQRKILIIVLLINFAFFTQRN